MTSPEYGIETREAFDIYAQNHEINADPAWFHGMDSIYEMYLKRLELLRVV